MPLDNDDRDNSPTVRIPAEIFRRNLDIPGWRFGAFVSVRSTADHYWLLRDSDGASVVAALADEIDLADEDGDNRGERLQSVADRCGAALARGS